MKKILYTNGDSFIFGLECLGDGDWTLENRDLAFPKYIGNSLGCETYINNAYAGANNDFIFKHTILDLKKLEESGVDPKDVFVVIGVTSLHRIEIDGNTWLKHIEGLTNKNGTPLAESVFLREYHDHKTVFLTPSNYIEAYDSRKNQIDPMTPIMMFCAKYLWTEPVQLESQEARLIALHEILKAKGYDHIFVNTVCPLEGTTHIDVNCKNFYNISTDSFFSYGYVNFPSEHRQDNHFSVIPHQEYAKKLIDYIKEHNLTS